MRARVILRELAANAVMGVPALRSLRLKRGRTADVADVGRQVDAYLRQFEFLSENLGPERLAGATVVEIGPGDCIPIGLLALGAGAARYVAVDRFLGDIAGEYARGVYARLAAAAPAGVRAGWAAAGLDPAGFPDGPGYDGRVLVVRKSVEQLEPADLPPAGVVYSFNCVEHLSDVAAGFARMAAVLAPDGVMLHRVDYGPHWMYTADDPLAFLTVPGWLWRRMGSNRGYPNRRRHSEVAAALDRLGLRYDSRVTMRFPPAAAAMARPRLARELAWAGDDDLTAADAEFVVARSAVTFRGRDARTILEDPPPVSGGVPGG